MKEFFINLLLNNSAVNIYIDNEEEKRAMLKWCEDNSIYIDYAEQNCSHGDYLFIENGELLITDRYLIRYTEKQGNKQLKVNFARIRKYLEV